MKTPKVHKFICFSQAEGLCARISGGGEGQTTAHKWTYARWNGPEKGVGMGFRGIYSGKNTAHNSERSEQAL